MRILLAEDDRRIANFVSKGLRENAYAVDVVGNGEDALYQVSVSDYDLIILDVMMPLKNGFEVCRELRQSGTTSNGSNSCAWSIQGNWIWPSVQRRIVNLI